MAEKAGSDSLADYQRGLLDEWSVFVATQAIDIGGARAFNVGDAVPASHVTRGVVSMDQVVKRSEAPAGMDMAVVLDPPMGANDRPSDEDIAAAEKANMEAGIKP